jgi:tight adherence protein C
MATSLSESMWPMLALGATIFLLTAGLVLLAAQGFKRTQLKRRLQRLEERPAESLDEASSGFVESFIRTTGPLARLALPDESWEESPIRAQFIHAGWRSANAPTVFFAIKTILTLGLPLAWLSAAVLFSEAKPLIISAGMLLCGLVGLYGPNLVLKHRVEARQRELFESFPDALDLMTVCMEAGLSLEGALSRVADEMAQSNQLLASELQLVVLEMRAGRGRDVALRNLARRNGLEEIESLVATLVQAEQFGVSVAGSLRTHSDLLRNRRQQQAEERAATVGTRLTFPLMACILPTLMIVVTGPAAVRLIASLKTLGTP